MATSKNSRRDREIRRLRGARAGSPDRAAAPSARGEVALAAPLPADRNALLVTPKPVLIALAVAATAAFIWAYWPTLAALVKVWDTEPDYSHGYFVAPIALYFLWARRHTFPGISHQHRIWPGIALLGLAATFRYLAAEYYLEPIDGWSLLLWFAGLAWVLGGRKCLRWSLPSIIFLIFMIPLPFRVERMLSLPLQQFAAMASGWLLQCFGLPAVAQGNTILLGSHTLEVEQACSGLTIFIGIAALAFAYVVLVRRSWWEKAILVFAVLPIALIANATRIVLTGLLMEYASDEAAQKFTHDLAGWLMLPFAALLFALTLVYLGWLFPSLQQLDVRALVRTQSAHPRPARGNP